MPDRLVQPASEPCGCFVFGEYVDAIGILLDSPTSLVRHDQLDRDRRPLSHQQLLQVSGQLERGIQHRVRVDPVDQERAKRAVGAHGAGVDLPAPAGVDQPKRLDHPLGHTGIPGRGVDNRDPPPLAPRHVEGGWWRFQRTPHRRGDTGEELT